MEPTLQGAKTRLYVCVWMILCVCVCACRFAVRYFGDGVDTMVHLYRLKRKIDENGV